MKKSFFSAAMALAAGFVVSCGPSAPKANLEGASKADSLAYNIGIAQTQGLTDYLVMGMGVDTAYMSDFAKGVISGVNADEKQTAYFTGIQIGQQEASRVIPSITSEVLGETGELNKKNYVKGFVAGIIEKGQKMTPAEAQEIAMTMMGTLKGADNSTAAQVDTFSYAIGLARTQGLKDYAMYRLGIDTAYYKTHFAKGVKEGFNLGENAKKSAFIAGVQIGQQLTNQMIPSISIEVFGEEGMLNTEYFLAGFITSVNEKEANATAAQFTAMRLMEEVKSERFNEQFGDVKAEGVAFLDSIAKVDGVVKTESGLCYQVITEGKGATPTNTDVVKVHYRGTLIDGTEFDSSYSRNEPTVFPVNGVIAGWTEALTMMPVGSKWMLYIPQELAYGSRDLGTIKPFSTLVFEVELLSIEQ